MMNEELILKLKKNIVAIGHLLWEKDLASGLNGNISARIEDETILLTAHGTCLGFLQEKDILKIDLNGNLLEEGEVSTEKLLHAEIYRRFPKAKAVVHTHTTYTNAYFLDHETLTPRIFEAKVYLGEVQSVEQLTPAVTDAGPVMDKLENNNIVVLRNHGVVAMGEDHFDCFLLIQALEDAVTIETLRRILSADKPSAAKKKTTAAKKSKTKKKYKLFSEEQIKEIVKLVNQDKTMKELGEKTDMTMDLAVKLNETGQTYRFAFRKGNISDIGRDENAEFIISAPEAVWRSVFNQEIDPFVATTQKKMQLKGDFAKISKWYAPCSRVFELWTNVPVE